jgi:hypothetical protein
MTQRPVELPLGPVQLLLTRKFRRENPGSTGPEESSSGFDQTVS